MQHFNKRLKVGTNVDTKANPKYDWCLLVNDRKVVSRDNDNKLIAFGAKV